MDYTKNYHLPQWVKEDRVMMDDFNRAMADIEGGLSGNAQAAAKAQNSANNAQSAADAARRIADAAYSPTQKPYVVGSYTGTREIISITLGFRPSYMIISGQASMSPPYNTATFLYYNGFSAGNTIQKRLEFTDTGFTVYPDSEERDYYPDLSNKDRVYDYIAFR